VRWRVEGVGSWVEWQSCSLAGVLTKQVTLMVDPAG
jgi:hypothetical protein